MIRILIIVLVNSLFCVSLFGVDIAMRLQNNPEAIWNMPASGIQKEFNRYGKCKWKDGTKIYLLFEHTPDKKEVYFLNRQICKASFCFIDKRIQRNTKLAQQVKAIYLTLKETSDKLNKDSYLKSINSLKSQIKNIIHLSRGRELKRKSRKWYRHTYLWNSSQYAASLKWAYSVDVKAPFEIKPILFTIFYNGTPFPHKPKEVEREVIKAKDLEKTSADKSASKMNKTVVDKDDFYLKVPMLTESSSRNSLSTSVARIMKFYDQEAAKKAGAVKPANTDSKKCTYNFSTPAKARYDIEKLLKKSFRVKEIMSPECFEDYIKFSSLINAYNGYAKNKLESQCYKIIRSRKRLKKTDYILMKTVTVKKKTGTAIYSNNGRNVPKNMYKKDTIYVYLTNMVEIILKMNDEAAWLKARSKRDSTVKKFKKKICKQILSGKPVLWDVILGIVSEKNVPQVKGKYVRIIVGYNDKTDEVIYSDSLGQWYEIKKMSWEKAWAITYKTLILISPKQRRL